MRQYKLEPKEIRLVQPKIDKKPNIMLIKGVRSGKVELKFHDPLVVYQEDGDYTPEIYQIYGNAQINVFDKRGEKDAQSKNDIIPENKCGTLYICETPIGNLDDVTLHN